MVMNESEHKESLEAIKKETARRLVLNSGNNAVWMLERELAKNHRVIDRAQGTFENEMDTSKVFVLNKLDKIYKRQLSFHQAQLDRYHKAAELRRLSGQHQQEINSLGKKWQTTIKTIQAERKMSQPDKNKKIEDFKEESKRRKLSRQKTILNFTYQREMRFVNMQ